MFATSLQQRQFISRMGWKLGLANAPLVVNGRGLVYGGCEISRSPYNWPVGLGEEGDYEKCRTFMVDLRGRYLDVGSAFSRLAHHH